MLRALGLVSSGAAGWVRAVPRRSCSEYSVRSHTCGGLGPGQVGAAVTLAGWVQAVRMDRFLLLRDRTGLCQVRLPDGSTLHQLPNESVVVLKGVVRERPAGQQNANMATGQIEVELTEVVETSKANPNLPVQQSKHVAAKEPLRMQYRYLDLRNADLQRNLMLRSKVTMQMRQFLIDKGFLDIETPTLFRRTPGGAKEFVVPTRSPGRFYSLVQSPQQFKQLLMVGGLDRYFQVARCYRDEGGKPDRQPEFTQLDLEVSFAGREEVLALVEDLLAACWPGPLPRPLQRMAYQEAMDCYGVDKPDTRYGNTIQDLRDHFRGCGFAVIEDMTKSDEHFIGGVFFDGDDTGCLKTVEKEVRSALADQIKEHQGSGEPMIISQVHSLDNTIVGSLLKKCDSGTTVAVREAMGAGRLGFIVCCRRDLALQLLGRLRAALALRILPDLADRPHAFLWVIDFPLFLLEDGQLESAHHPFTAPHPADRHLLRSNPLACRSLHYDLVLDGQEIGGGSVRIHCEEEQRYVLRSVLGEEEAELEHLLAALGSGAPPHAGIALGLDRLLAVMARAASIRDVIAFPKSSEGRDLMGGAPAAITPEQRRLYHLEPAVA